jgi:membrane protein
LTAVGLTIGVALFILVSFALVLLGPRLAETIADRTVLGPTFEWTWKILQWPLVFTLASIGIAMIYYFAPDVEQDWIWLTPGSLFATTIWLIASLGFKYYVTNMGAYVETYGAIGGVMVLMLWFYISGLAILIGAEMNAEIEHASPYGKDEGEKVPGQKRKIGAARMREWIARRRQHGEKPPSSQEVKEAVGPPPPDKEPGAPIPPVPRGIARPAEQAPPTPRPLTPTPVTAFTTVKKTALDVLIGAGIIVAAEAWLAVKMLKKLRS